MIKGVNERGEEVEVEKATIRFFGTEIVRNTDRKGDFKSFTSRSWVKDGGEKVYVDMKITDLKHLFPNYDSSKRIIQEEKKGKMKKATEWSCEVTTSGDNVLLNGEQLEILSSAIKRHVPVEIKHSQYYYIFDKVFRRNDKFKNNYYYFSEKKKKLVDMGVSPMDAPSKADLENWIRSQEEN